MHVKCKREKRGMRKREREREMCCVVISFTILLLLSKIYS